MVCFFVDAIRDTYNNFATNYMSDSCSNLTIDSSLNTTVNLITNGHCERETSVLAIVLLLGTLWLSLSVLQLKESPYLNRVVRGAIAEYALPIGVIVFR